MVYLDLTSYGNLCALAHAQNTSMTKVMGKALKAYYQAKLRDAKRVKCHAKE